MTFLGLVGLFSIIVCSDLQGGFLFFWGLSLMPLLLVSLSTSVFRSSSICFVVPMLLLLVSSKSCFCLVVV